MFGIGATEWLLIIVVLILLFGAKKIPEIARGLGKSVSEFKRGVREGEEESKPKTDGNSQPPKA